MAYAFGSHVLFSMVLANMRPQCYSVLDFFAAEGTVEGETVDVVAFYVLPAKYFEVRSSPKMFFSTDLT